MVIFQVIIWSITGQKVDQWLPGLEGEGRVEYLMGYTSVLVDI